MITNLKYFFQTTFARFVDKLNELMEPVKQFFLDNSRNPVLWIGIILLGLVLFEFVYNMLNKD